MGADSAHDIPTLFWHEKMPLCGHRVIQSEPSTTPLQLCDWRKRAQPNITIKTTSVLMLLCLIEVNRLQVAYS